jgi:hypothetical protein
MVSRIEHEQTLLVQTRTARAVEPKSLAVTITASVLGVAAVFVTTRSEGGIGALEPVLLVVALGLVGVAIRNWETGVQTLLVVVIIEGAIRKWFLPSFSEMVYFYKDILMVATLIGYWRKRRKAPLVIKRQLALVSTLVAVFVVYALVAFGLPGGPPVLIGLLGVKAYCLYIPMAFITPRAFPDKERLIRFLRWYLVIVLPVAVIGAMQFLDSDTQSSLNRYAVEAGAATEIAGFSSRSGKNFVRITGTFSYITGLAVYLPIMFALLLAMTALYLKRGLTRAQKALYYGALGATVVTCFMTGSRGSLLSMLVVAVIFYLFTSGRQAFRRLRQIAMITAILWVAFSNFFPEAFDAFYNRAFAGEQQVDEGKSRLMSLLGLPTEEVSYAGIFGYGIGWTQNAVPALIKRFNMAAQQNPIPIPSEGEAGRVTLELGVLGFALWTLLRLLLLFTVLRMSFSIRDRESKILAFAASAALALPLAVGGAVSTHTQNVYQWFLIGVVFALYNADRLALRAQDRGPETGGPWTVDRSAVVGHPSSIGSRPSSVPGPPSL